MARRFGPEEAAGPERAPKVYGPTRHAKAPPTRGGVSVSHPTARGVTASKPTGKRRNEPVADEWGNCPICGIRFKRRRGGHMRVTCGEYTCKAERSAQCAREARAARDAKQEGRSETGRFS